MSDVQEPDYTDETEPAPPIQAPFDGTPNSGTAPNATPYTTGPTGTADGEAMLREIARLRAQVETLRASGGEATPGISIAALMAALKKTGNSGKEDTACYGVKHPVGA